MVTVLSNFQKNHHLTTEQRQKAEKNKNEYFEMQSFSEEQYVPFFETKLMEMAEKIEGRKNDINFKPECASFMPLEDRENLSIYDRKAHLFEDFTKLSSTVDLLSSVSYIDDALNEASVNMVSSFFGRAGFKEAHIGLEDETINAYQKKNKEHKKTQAVSLKKNDVTKEDLSSLYFSLRSDLDGKWKAQDEMIRPFAADKDFDGFLAGVAGSCKSDFETTYSHVSQDIQPYCPQPTTRKILAEQRNKLLDLETKEKGLGILSFVNDEYNRFSLKDIPFTSDILKNRYAEYDKGVQNQILNYTKIYSTDFRPKTFKEFEGVLATKESSYQNSPTNNVALLQQLKNKTR